MKEEFSYQDVINKFTTRYHTNPLVVKAPGRINLIGEHTDYNDGFVMPAAINYSTVFAIALASDGVSEVYASKYNETFIVDVVNPQPVREPKWVNYLLGVLRQFVDMGLMPKAFKCAFGGDIPMGAGLSSSASMECGFAYAINELNGFNVDKKKLVEMAQWSEHHFVGVKCGIMDQFASMMGAEGKVIVLDCRSLDYHYSPLKLSDHVILLCDTKVKHSLVDSEYNTRRSECEEGVALLRKHYPEIRSLRDVSPEMIERHKDLLKGKVYDRCLYVVEEIKRVQEASEDLKANRLQAFGQKMFATHHGLSKLYEVSCVELDFLVEQAQAFEGILGSRMMGGGFGGCTINIIEKDKVETFVKRAGEAYQKQFGRPMEPHVVTITDGTGIMEGVLVNA